MKMHVRLRVFTQGVHRHRHLIAMLGSMFVILIIAFVVNYEYTQQGVRATYTRTFEQGALTNLSLAQADTTSLLKTIMTTNLDTIANLANDQTVQTAAATRQVTLIQPIVDRERNENDEFDTIGLLDAHGILISSSTNTASKTTVSDLNSRDYYVQAVKTGKPYISPAFVSAFGNYSIAFSAPVFSGNHTLVGVLFAVTHLDALHERLNLNSPFRTIYSAVIDASGNVILESDHDTVTRQNVLAGDRLVSQVISSKVADSTSEIDYRGTSSLADVTPIDLGNNNYLYLATYYPNDQLQSQIDGAMAELDNAFSDNLIRDLAALSLAYLVVYYLIRRMGSL